MNKIKLLIVAGIFIIATSASADMIYLKSGDVLEGKIREKKAPPPMGMDYYCLGDDKVIVGGRCVARDDIERIEKEYKKPEGVALLAKEDKWGDEENGYKTQLIPASDEYRVGEPMKLHLVVTNIEDKVKFYDSQGITRNTLTIKNEDGDKVYYKYGSFQTSSYWGGTPIDKGEINVLFDDIDIEREYVISEPGKYTIQFQGGGYGLVDKQLFPPSNVLEIDVKPGAPREKDVLISSLLKILPKGWRLTPNWDRTNPPVGRNAVEGFSLGFVRHPESGLKEDVVYIRLWQMKEATGLVKKEGDSENEISEFLGYNLSGYYYIHIPRGAGGFWPTVREDIVAALKLEK